MEYNINYRGLVLNIKINQDETTVWYTKNSNIYTLSIFDRETSKKNKSANIPFNVSIKDSEGSLLGTNRYSVSIKNTYDYFYNIVSNRSMGDYLDRGSVNAVLEYHFMEQVFPFNIVSDYDEMQPVIFDYTTDNSSITVNLVDYDNTKTVQYSLDGNNWQSENSFNDLDNGAYVIYVKTLEDGYIFEKSFYIA